MSFLDPPKPDPSKLPGFMIDHQKQQLLIDELCKSHSEMVDAINTIIANQNGMMQKLIDLEEGGCKCK